MSGRRVDLDTLRAARDEVDPGDPPVVILAGDEYELPAKLSAPVLYGLARLEGGHMAGFADVMDGLFGEKAGDAIAAGLELEDLGEIISGAYGVDLPESSASDAS